MVQKAKELNLVLCDFKTDDNFPLTYMLNKENPDIRWKSEGHFINKKNRVIRIIDFIFYPLKVLSKKNLKRVVCWQQYYGILLAIYSSIFKRTVEINILTFIYKKRKGILGKIIYHLFNIALNSTNVNKVICYSKNECMYYKQIFKSISEKFYYTSFGVYDDGIDIICSSNSPKLGGGVSVFSR